MEDNDILFWEGLLNILKEPWKIPPVIQDTIPPLALTTIEDSNPDAEKQDTIGFYHIRLLFPFYFTVAYFVQNNKHFFSYFTDGDGLIVFNLIYKAPRLTTHDIYEVFSWLDSDCALVLLEHIDCPFSVYTELKESLEANEKERFIEVMDNLDLANIIPTLGFVRFVINTISFIQDKAISKDNNVVEDDMDCEVKKSRILYNLDKTLTDKLGYPAKGYEKQVMLSMAERCLNMEVLPEAFFNFWYSSLYNAYCWTDEDGFLTESDKKVFEYIFHQPAFEEQYNQNLDWWKNGILEEKVREFVKEFGGFEVIDSSQEPAEEEKKDTPIPVKSDFIEQGPTKEEEHLYPNSKYEFIPENYFSEKIDKAHPDDHYELVDEIIAEGEELFAGFINYIAGRQYIENDDKTKALFAYRLSGRMRPDGDLDPIPWWAEDKSPNELLYVIRYCVDKGSHKKFSVQMKDFFEGPDWPTEGYSTKADDADTNFRKALNAMYAVCGLKYTKPKKKK